MAKSRKPVGEPWVAKTLIDSSMNDKIADWAPNEQKSCDYISWREQQNTTYNKQQYWCTEIICDFWKSDLKGKIWNKK